MQTMAKIGTDSCKQQCNITQGCLLRDVGQGYSPATMNVAHLKKSLAVWFPAYFVVFPWQLEILVTALITEFSR